MNFLAHTLLSGPRPAMQIGGFLGDFVKGPLRGDYPPEIEAGIQLHRNIDGFSDTLPALQELHTLLPSRWRRYNGILSDVLYDHLLALHWQDYHPEPIDLFCNRFYQHLAQQQHLLPDRARRLGLLGLSEPWLQGYGRHSAIAQVLTRIGGRLRRPVPLQEALYDIEPQMPQYRATFEAVFPVLQAFAARERRLLLSNLPDNG